MRHRWSLVIIVWSLVTLVAPIVANAEVRARTNRRGQYQTTEVSVGRSRWAPKVWSLFTRTAGPDVLNPNGDHTGDLWPEIGETPVAPYLPWVVWSRRNERGLGLAWSRWQPGQGWQSILWIAPDGALGNDLDPSLAFNGEGRPFVAWWRQDASGRGQVYLSVFLATKWLAPWLVTETGADARFPNLTVNGDGSLEVVYETADGWVTQGVQFIEPVTILDDINPLDHLRSDGEPVPIQHRR